MADSTESVDSNAEKVIDFGSDPRSIARRWKLELKLASKREENWRKKAKAVYEQYTPENPIANSFNILWTNTETLRQAVYNSLPKPDIRRRYQDNDELGKNVAEVLTRSLEFSQDTECDEEVFQGDVLCMLLAGRAASRVRYVPDIRQIGGMDESDLDNGSDEESQESESYEEIGWEQCPVERIQYDDLRIGPGKRWSDVTWIAFRHQMGRDELIDKFGESIGSKIPLDKVDDDDVNKSKDAELFKTAEVWEIWDKDEKKVLFISNQYERPCKTQDDPLGLNGFFPIPRPIYAIESDRTLVPTTLYSQYEQQAKELNRISVRINKLIEGLKVRGIYDSTLTELSELTKANDNEMVAASNVMALLERGGLEKAIWMMPIETAAIVLKTLYEQREATKAVIYEITGIADIMRAASDPSETFGAQKIKTTWGTQRLQRIQQEVQRYIRDIIRLKAEVISNKFQMSTLEQMTLMELPHEQEVQQQYQQQLMQYQGQVQQFQLAQQQGQQAQPPQQPQPLNVITWEKVYDAMQNDAMRTFRVDIETDSTLSASQTMEMGELKDLLSGVTQLVEGMGPIVQMGAMPADALKEIMLAVVRRAKMGPAVEDALDKMQQPPPPQDPNAGQAQIEQQKTQGQMQVEQFKAQLQDQQHQRELAANQAAQDAEANRHMQMEMHKQEMQSQENQHQQELEAQREMQRQGLESAAEERKAQNDLIESERQRQFEMWKIEQENATRIAVAEIGAKSTLDAAQLSAARAESSGGEIKEPPTINIHMPANKRTIKKNPDGSYTSEDN